MTKKFTFNDLQPRVEMLIDALENRGSCASGLPYNPEVKKIAEDYKALLGQVRGEQRLLFLDEQLDALASIVMEKTGDNQRYRIQQIVDGISIFMKREYGH
jgi:hypothetical protein